MIKTHLRTLGLILAMLITIPLVTEGNAQSLVNDTNLLKNGSFEYAFTGEWQVITGTLQKSTDIKCNGGASLLLDRSGETNQTIAQSLTTLIPGTQYTLSYYQKIVDGAQAYVKIYQFNRSGSIIRDSNFNITGNAGSIDWEKKTASFVVDESTVRIRIDLNNNAYKGQAYFDDLVLIKGEVQAKENLLKNASFEESFIGNWFVNSGKLQRSADVKCEGNLSLLLERSGENPATQSISQSVSNVISGKQYTLSYYQKIIGGAQLYAAVYQFNASGSLVTHSNFNVTANPGSADWEKKTVSFTLDESTARLRIDLNNNAHNGKGYFDGVVLIQGAPEVNKNQLTNGSFEETFIGNWYAQSGTLQRSADVKSHDNLSLLLDRSGGVSQVISQTVTGLTPGARYTLSYWQKIIGGSQIYVKIYQFNSAGNLIANSINYNLTSTTSDVNWERKTATFTLDENALTIRIDLNNNARLGQGYFDHIILAKSGDFNYDNECNFLDLEYAEKILLKQDSILIDYERTAADFNGDGGFDIIDLLHLKEVLISLDT